MTREEALDQLTAARRAIEAGCRPGLVPSVEKCTEAVARALLVIAHCLLGIQDAVDHMAGGMER